MKEYKSKINELKLQRVKSDIKKVKISSSKDVSEYARGFYQDDLTIYESMFVVFLNRANNTIGWVKMSQGGINGTVIENRIVCKYAIDTLCTSVVLVHNHPSGNKNPSDADIKITKKLVEALKVFDVILLDHVILTEDSYYSLMDEGRL